MGKIIYLGGFLLNEQKRNESAINVAKWFLQNNDTLCVSTRESNLKLQKLVYYAQCMHLAVFETPLYTEKIQAWENGPVVREVYDQYRYQELGCKAMRDESVKINGLQEDVLRVVNILYGSKTADELVNLTHNEGPWKEKEELVRYRINPEIEVNRIKEYYACLKDVFEAFSDYSVVEHQYKSGSNTFTFQEGTELSQDDKLTLDEFSYDLVGKNLFVSKDNNGGLVIY